LAKLDGYTILVPAVERTAKTEPASGRRWRPHRSVLIAARTAGSRLWPGRDARILGRLYPLSQAAKERRTTGDPRRSILKRYWDTQSYV
jgi:hypothetical protein